MGGTYEPIDPIRGITNKSSGKMGLELAKQAYIRGFDVTLIVANVSVKIPSVFDVIKVETAGEMNDVIKELIPAQDIFILLCLYASYITVWTVVAYSVYLFVSSYFYVVGLFGTEFSEGYSGCFGAGIYVFVGFLVHRI